MKLVIGLGNPEKEYVGTRHNIGKMIVNMAVCHVVGNDNFNIKKLFKKVLGHNICGHWDVNKKLNAEILKINNIEIGNVMFVKPLCYMNDSGIIVRDVSQFYKVDFDNILIIYDDLDLKVGEFKMKKGGATKVHNGIASILELIGERNFKKITYVKFGVREKRIPMSVKNFGLRPNKYVLSKFPKEDKFVVEKTIKDDVLPAIFEWLSK